MLKSSNDAPYQALDDPGAGVVIATAKQLPNPQTQGKTAVFVDGCFWHGCPKHATWPKTRAAFWRTKLEANRARDRKVNRLLRQSGWKVLRIWEHELSRKDEAKFIRRLRKLLPA